MPTYQAIADRITGIRYGKLGTILFEYAGRTITISEPIDVLLVGYDVPASKWIANHYGFLLANVG